MTIKVLYKTDFHHSHSSKEVIGYYLDDEKLRDVCKTIITKDIYSDSDELTLDEENEKIEYNFNFLFEHNQTQDLNNFELVIEEVESGETDMRMIDEECDFIEYPDKTRTKISINDSINLVVWYDNEVSHVYYKGSEILEGIRDSSGKKEDLIYYPDDKKFNEMMDEWADKSTRKEGLNQILKDLKKLMKISIK